MSKGHNATNNQQFRKYPQHRPQYIPQYVPIPYPNTTNITVEYPETKVNDTETVKLQNEIKDMTKQISVMQLNIESLNKQIETIKSEKKSEVKKKDNPFDIFMMPINPNNGDCSFQFKNDESDPISSIFGSLFGGEFPGPKKQIKKDDDSDDEVGNVSEHNSEEDFDELDVEIKTIDDLIKLGQEYGITNPPKKTGLDAIPDANELRKRQGDSRREQLKKELSEKIIPKNKEQIEKPVVSPTIKGFLPRDGNMKLFKNGPISLKDMQTKPPIDVPKQVYTLNNKKYYINLETLAKLVKPLTKLQSMIGLDKVKSAIVDMILYYLQQFEKKNNNMLHTMIEGPPGVGKTQLGKILAEIYAGLGVIPSSKFKLVKRSDLVGEYLGHTAPKVQKLIDEADGGILFIDEAYALGNKDKKDSFSKEAIDTINQNLSEKKRKFICIIAGYPDELEECFFSYNPGLKRRFPFKFNIEGYKPEELKHIFVKKVNDLKWNICKDVDPKELTELFAKNKDKFPYYGGDIENYLLNCKMVHAKRVFGKHPKNKRKLNKIDLEIGLERFVANKKTNMDIPLHLQHLYN